MEIISVREKPNYKERAIEYFQEKWAHEGSLMVYEDVITHSITTESPLPHFYLLEKKSQIMGCAGLITNDFISRMDLYPWICALYIEEEYRGREYGSVLLEKGKEDAREGGFSHIYLCTDHIGYYEKYGFTFIGIGYHPWNESSRIYQAPLHT